jgi:hypothetical protein
MPSFFRSTTHLLDVLLISLYGHERTPFGFSDTAVKVIMEVASGD